MEIKVSVQSEWNPSYGHSLNLQELSELPVETDVLGRGPSCGHLPSLQGLLSVGIDVLGQGDRDPLCSHLPYLGRPSPVEIDVSGQSENELDDNAAVSLDNLVGSEDEEDEIDSLLNTGTSGLEA